jgi:hypothetical protein
MLYFIITYSIGNFMMLSLFTAVLLGNFESGNDEDSEEENDEDLKNLPKKTFCMKLKSFGRSLKIEYFRAFATDPRVLKQVTQDNKQAEEREMAQL